MRARVRLAQRWQAPVGMFRTTADMPYMQAHMQACSQAYKSGYHKSQHDPRHQDPHYAGNRHPAPAIILGGDGNAQLKRERIEQVLVHLPRTDPRNFHSTQLPHNSTATGTGSSTRRFPRRTRSETCLSHELKFAEGQTAGQYLFVQSGDDASKSRTEGVHACMRACMCCGPVVHRASGVCPLIPLELLLIAPAILRF